MEITEVDETHCEGRQPSCEDVTATARHDLPLCPNRMITALEAVRGTGSALELLREHLHVQGRPVTGLARLTVDLGLKEFRCSFCSI